jgi:hypothetical protein
MKAVPSNKFGGDLVLCAGAKAKVVPRVAREMGAEASGQ